MPKICKHNLKITDTASFRDYNIMFYQNKSSYEHTEFGNNINYYC